MVFEMQVIWSNKAKITYFKILDYLKDNWTKREIVRFAKRSQIVIQAICKNPQLFPTNLNHKDIRRAIVDKNNSFFYKVDSYKQIIYILTFYDNRQDPNKLTL